MEHSELSERRRLLLDAGLRVIVTQGLRGLTHRAVDREARLAEGSTSAYLRTRRALQTALAHYVSARLAADVDQVVVAVAGCGPESDEAVEHVLGLFGRWLDEGSLVQAKIELTLEAARDPELAAIITAERRRVVEVLVAILGEDEPSPVERAEALASAFDGILLAALLKAPGQRDRFLSSALALTMHPLARTTPSPA